MKKGSKITREGVNEQYKGSSHEDTDQLYNKSKNVKFEQKLPKRRASLNKTLLSYCRVDQKCPNTISINSQDGSGMTLDQKYLKMY